MRSASNASGGRLAHPQPHGDIDQLAIGHGVHQQRDLIIGQSSVGGIVR
jgi:hypothetical protein